MFWNLHSFAGVLSAEETSALHQILTEICDQFGFGSDDKAARESIAEALMVLAHLSIRSSDTARSRARDVALAIARERGMALRPHPACQATGS